MARRRDLFARLSLDYADHPKIAGLSDAAFRTHVEMILYSRRYLTDGRIAKQVAKRWPEQALSELLANDDETPSLRTLENGDYLLHGFEEMQETRAEVERKRRIRAESGRLGGLAKGKQSGKQPASKLPSKNVPETETETETERGTTARKRAASLPTDWQPTDEHIKRAREDGTDLAREVIKFRAWADEGQTSKNWNSRFTRWLMNAAEYQQRNGGRPANGQRPGESLWDLPATGTDQ